MHVMVTQINQIATVYAQYYLHYPGFLTRVSRDLRRAGLEL